MTTPPDIFSDAVWSILSTVHTCLPAVVIDFNPSTNKATIQPALNKAYFSGEMPMPVLTDVPMMFPKNIVFPVNEGDYVLLLFAERSIDLWLNEGGVVTPNDRRKFNLSDAIAIPGLQTFNDDFSGNDGTSFKISYAGSNIRIEQNGNIIIETGNRVGIGNSTTEVLDIISQLMALLQGTTVMGTSFGGPLNPAFTAQVLLIQNQIDALKAVIP